MKSREYCRIVLPWGIYEYGMLSMGVVVATDIFQARLANLFSGLEYVVIYLDDILIIGIGSFDELIKKVTEVLERLLRAAM